MQNSNIDHGKPFDFGKTSEDYAKYRDIYPDGLYKTLLDAGVGLRGQKILDLGTGTGVLPRAMAKFGASFTGIDIAANQIEQAIALSHGDEIEFRCAAAEDCGFAADTFDAATACQCLTYFDHPKLAPLLADILKVGGLFAVAYMAWLPDEDPIADASERLILHYNPDWSGCCEKRHLIDIPKAYDDYFCVQSETLFDADIPFSRDSWNGRIKSCRGVGAALSANDLAKFDREHRQLLEKIAPPSFTIKHYVAVTVLKNRKLG